MTKNEKIYFVKKLSSSDLFYVKLFQYISKQKKYNEEVLKKHFVGTYIATHFPFAKNYLYNTILRSLQQFSSSKKDINFYFSAIDILYKKGLYKDCFKLLKQLYKKVVAVDDYLSILRVIEYAKFIQMAGIVVDKDLDIIVSMEFDIQKKQLTRSTFQSLLIQSKIIIQKRGSLSLEEKDMELKEIQAHPYLQNKDHLIDRHCSQMYHEILFMIESRVLNIAAAEKHVRQLQKMIDDPDYESIMKGQTKVKIMHRMIYFYRVVLDIENLILMLETLKSELNSNKDLLEQQRLSSWGVMYTYQTDMLIFQRKFSEADVVIEQATAFFKKNKAKLRREDMLIIMSNILILHFLRREFKEVLKLTDILITDNNVGLRKDLLTGMMLVEVIVYFDLKKMGLFESRFSSFVRHLKGQKVNEPLYELFVQFFNDSQSGKEMELMTRSLMTGLDDLPQHGMKNDGYFFIEWVKEKLEPK